MSLFFSHLAAFFFFGRATTRRVSLDPHTHGEQLLSYPGGSAFNSLIIILFHILDFLTVEPVEKLLLACLCGHKDQEGGGGGGIAGWTQGKDGSKKSTYLSRRLLGSEEKGIIRVKMRLA